MDNKLEAKVLVSCRCSIGRGDYHDRCQGDPTAWPFDSYATDAISADAIVGSGDEREFQPARVEVEAAIQGWGIECVRAAVRAVVFRFG